MDNFLFFHFAIRVHVQGVTTLPESDRLNQCYASSFVGSTDMVLVEEIAEEMLAVCRFGSSNLEIPNQFCSVQGASQLVVSPIQLQCNQQSTRLTWSAKKNQTSYDPSHSLVQYVQSRGINKYSTAHFHARNQHIILPHIHLRSSDFSRSPWSGSSTS